jgi:hypothetical protein
MSFGELGQPLVAIVVEWELLVARDAREPATALARGV